MPPALSRWRRLGMGLRLPPARAPPWRRASAGRRRRRRPARLRALVLRAGRVGSPPPPHPKKAPRVPAGGQADVAGLPHGVEPPADLLPQPPAAGELAGGFKRVPIQTKALPPHVQRLAAAAGRSGASSAQTAAARPPAKAPPAQSAARRSWRCRRRRPQSRRRMRRRRVLRGPPCRVRRLLRRRCCRRPVGPAVGRRRGRPAPLSGPPAKASCPSPAEREEADLLRRWSPAADWTGAPPPQAPGWDAGAVHCTHVGVGQGQRRRRQGPCRVRPAADGAD